MKCEVSYDTGSVPKTVWFSFRWRYGFKIGEWSTRRRAKEKEPVSTRVTSPLRTTSRIPECFLSVLPTRLSVPISRSRHVRTVCLPRLPYVQIFLSQQLPLSLTPTFQRRLEIPMIDQCCSALWNILMFCCNLSPTHGFLRARALLSSRTTLWVSYQLPISSSCSGTPS